MSRKNKKLLARSRSKDTMTHNMWISLNGRHSFMEGLFLYPQQTASSWPCSLLMSIHLEGGNYQICIWSCIFHCTLLKWSSGFHKRPSWVWLVSVNIPYMKWNCQTFKAKDHITNQVEIPIKSCPSQGVSWSPSSGAMTKHLQIQFK